MVRSASARSVKPCADFTNTRQRNAAYEFTGTAYQWPVAEQALPDAASAVTVAEANPCSLNTGIRHHRRVHREHPHAGAQPSAGGRAPKIEFLARARRTAPPQRSRFGRGRWPLRGAAATRPLGGTHNTSADQRPGLDLTFYLLPPKYLEGFEARAMRKSSHHFDAHLRTCLCRGEVRGIKEDHNLDVG